MSMRIMSQPCQSLPLKTRVSLTLEGNIIAIYHEEQCLDRVSAIPYRTLFARRLQFDALVESDGIMPIRYAGTHQHSWGSLLDGMVSPSQMAERIEYYGAITDHGNMHMHFEFYNAMLKQKKKPIIGFEAYVESWHDSDLMAPAIEVAFDESMDEAEEIEKRESEEKARQKGEALEDDEEEIETLVEGEEEEAFEAFEWEPVKDSKPGSTKGRRRGNHLVLLAKNNVGLQNLIKLTTLGWDNVYRKPHVKWEWLAKHCEGIICTTACLGGEVSQCLLHDNYAGACEVLSELIRLFGQDNVYVEIQRHDMPEERKVNPLLEKLANELGVKIIAATDSHYAFAEDAYHHELQLCMQTKKKMDEPHFKFPGTLYHMQTSDEMADLFSDHPEWLDETLNLAERCHVTIETGNYHLPEFPLPTQFETQEALFRDLCEKGFQRRFAGTSNLINDEYRERLNFEMDVISRMGFCGYFNIVQDFVNWAKGRGILVGPGRGSACGSLVSYVLNITNLDPIEYHLLFERFLNPDRISMPDIDIDFQDDRREEVIDYVKMKYGENAVSRIVTFGKLKPRNAIRDVTRVLVFDKSEATALANKICKSITSTRPDLTISEALVECQDFSHLYETDSRIHQIVEIAIKMEGLPRQTGQHACGVLITPGTVSDYIPQMMAKNSKTGQQEVTTQLPKGECEKRGLLKVDFLGLRTLSVIAETIALANQRSDVQTPIVFDNIPLEEIETYQMLAKGQTAGVFQLESSGMTDLMKQMYQDLDKIASDSKAGRECFERLVAGLSLYRPGPIKEIPNYIRYMLAPQEIHYEIPALATYLDSTYSIIVYQEQVMQIVRELAGFSKGQADYIRKGMASKVKDAIEECRQWFIDGDEIKGIDGCVKRGISRDVAESLWHKMEEFGKYAFNRSHAGGYGVVSVKSAWLACHYPIEYMTATLNSYLDNADRIRLYMGQCARKGIEVLPPHVNHSVERFSVEGGHIRFGLRGIRNLGKFSRQLITVRTTDGDFQSLEQLLIRLSKSTGVNKRQLEAMIYSGMLDDFKGTRQTKLAQMPKWLEMSKFVTRPQQFMSYLFAQTDAPATQWLMNRFYATLPADLPEFERRYKLEQEYKYTGFYVSEHPLDAYEKFLTGVGYEALARLNEAEKEEDDDYTSFESEQEDSSLENLTHATCYHNGDIVTVAGVIQEVTTRISSYDQRTFGTFTLQDRTGSIKCVCYSKQYEAYASLLVEGAVVMLEARIKKDSYGIQLNIQDITDLIQLEQEASQQPIAIQPVLTGIRILGQAKDDVTARAQYQYLLTFLTERSGGVPIAYHHAGRQQDFVLPCGLNASSEIYDELVRLVGEVNIQCLYA